jgi:hypothetical protein
MQGWGWHFYGVFFREELFRLFVNPVNLNIKLTRFVHSESKFNLTLLTRKRYSSIGGLILFAFFFVSSIVVGWLWFGREYFKICVDYPIQGKEFSGIQYGSSRIINTIVL